MKEEEFNLSEKDHNMSMMPGDEEEHMYLQKDIKEFIKRLKLRCGKGTCGIIDELAGDDLS